MNEYIQYIIEAGDNFLNFLTVLFGLEITYLMLLICILVVIFLIVLYILLSKVSKKIIYNEQKFIYEFDNVFYHIAASQYKVGLKSDDVNAKDEHLDIIKNILKLKKPEYISNLDTIKSSVAKIEKKLGKKITHKSVWDNIDLYSYKWKKGVLWSKILKLSLIVVVLVSVGVMIYV